MYKSRDFVYYKTLETLGKYMPGAALEYNADFWAAFSPYYYNCEDTAQAVVGELVHNRREATKFVFKISRREDNLVLHEYEALREVAERLPRDFPHVARPYGIVKYKSAISPRNGIFKGPADQNFVYRNMLLVEHIKYLCPLSDFLIYATAEDIVAVLKQILMCVRAFRRAKITHYDLHTDNILISKCPADLCLQYNFDKVFKVHTRGFLPVIIDYGFTGIMPAMGETPPLFGSLGCIYSGHFVDRFSPFTDYIRVFYSIALELEKETGADLQKIRRVLLKPFARCSHIDRATAWEQDSTMDVTRLCRLVETRVGRLKLFERSQWLEPLNIFMPRPLPAVRRFTFDAAPFKIFQAQWAIIEKRVTNWRILLYLFKYLVDLIYKYRAAPHQTALVKTAFLDEFARLINSFIPDLDYRKLIDSIKGMAAQSRDFHAELLTARCKYLANCYQCLPFKTSNCDDYLWALVEQNVFCGAAPSNSIIEEIQWNSP